MRDKVRCVAITLFLLSSAASGFAAAHGITKLYVSNSQGDDITVIDIATRSVIGDIRVGEHVHGLCAPSDGRRLFTTIESEDNL